MGRHSCCLEQKIRKGLWSPEEDEKLYNHIIRYGVGCWSSVPKLAGILQLSVVSNLLLPLSSRFLCVIQILLFSSQDCNAVGRVAD
ncbi:hypothetical protein GW17_00047758 [Ensete ventricosum]|uniref:Uncharacterized protein n=1 Tax=Ensete ventricosum TaxID=4639 RepID=A0A427AQK4_ENSVE|nr:hypothetical protein B296_00002055 [Ensete ventricosum]RWV90066.1 hypothetical protein GW17_00047758 [Ensete ventricosum]